MKKIRDIILKISNIFHLTNYLFKIWFMFLGLKNGIIIKFHSNYLLLRKKGKEIKIKKGKNDFGSIGIVLRDFENFYSTIVLDNNQNIIDFSIPKFHKVATGHNFFFHDICEPIATTNIYIEKANLKKNGEVVLDLGSYCGTQTVYYSEAVGPNGLVIAFEPDNDSFNSLQLNVKQSVYKNIIIENKGVYSYNGVVSFTNTGGMASSISNDINQNSVNIDVVTLDSVATKYSLTRCDFIKMDIEGSEIEVLKSSKKFIEIYKPKFIIEPHYLNGNLNTLEIIEIFNSLNYETEIIKQGNQDYQPLIFAFPIF